MAFSKKYKRKYYKKKKNKKIATRGYVKKLMSKTIETKYFDVSFVDFDVSNIGGVYRLTGLAQGIPDTERIGDKVTLRAVKPRISFQLADVWNVIRLIIFQWYPNTTFAAPSVARVLAPEASSTVGVHSHYVHDYQNQFQVLYDKYHVLDTINPFKIMKIKLKTKYMKKTINYTAATQDGSNHIYMLLISDSTAVTHPTFFCTSRIWYDDA